METLLADAVPTAAPTLVARDGHRYASRIPETPRWRVIAPLGEGGMGTLWEVEHVELGRRAALKTPHAHQRGRGDIAGRLRDEARALARVSHANIPDVLDMGELDDGRPFFVMELVRGTDLRSEIARLGVLAVPTATRVIGALLDALEAVHGAGMIHRDVKLENVVLGEDGRVVLVDFGLALRLDDELRRTGHGRAVGTPRCMSPEQHARGHVDQRTDLYAVGLCLFELIAGRGPFDEPRATVLGMHRAHCERTPPRLGDVAPQLVPRELEEVARRALAKAPEDRFACAASMREALVDATSLRPGRWDDESPFAATIPSADRPLEGLLDLLATGTSSGSWEVASCELLPV